MQIFGLTSDRPPATTYTARAVSDVPAILNRAEAAAAAGRWVVLFVTYDAAPALEPVMRVQGSGESSFPLAWAAEFDMLHDVASRADLAATLPTRAPVFTPSIDEDTFCEQVRRAQHYIAEGDTYQVNLSFPLTATPPDDLRMWFEQLHATQQASYAAYLDLGRHVVLSLSPELFFETNGSVIRTRPMKGTIRRGRWSQEDEALARVLATSRKAQAENVMIVDLLRNDIGRVAAAGTVAVPHLFSVERYPTLWQLTSTVEGTLESSATLLDIFKALFPCGSVTGAPKIRTMEIIAGLEQTRRGLYTGTIGLLRPGGNATFNVAIRTIVVDRQAATATLGVGAGITADSVPEDEYAECLLKGAFASYAGYQFSEPFQLLETMRLENGVVVRLDRHLRRMRQSARFFGFIWREPEVEAAVAGAAAEHPGGVWRTRLLVDANSVPVVACTPHADPPAGAEPWRVAFAGGPVDEHDPFLFNKTTNRRVHEAARRSRPDVDDVLLWNTRGELTESTIANVVVEIDGRRYTPPIDCGLLAGTLRDELLETGEIAERVITRGEVMRATRIWLINSVRGWVDAVVVR